MRESERERERERERKRMNSRVFPQASLGNAGMRTDTQTHMKAMEASQLKFTALSLLG
jgi:hypothetical protein